MAVPQVLWLLPKAESFTASGRGDVEPNFGHEALVFRFRVLGVGHSGMRGISKSLP